jgi:hypothetical protein
MSQTINGKTYTDIDAVCQDCGKGYVFTAGEQAFFASKGFTPPKRCKPCRERNRTEKNRQREERSMPTPPDEPYAGRGNRNRD